MSPYLNQLNRLNYDGEKRVADASVLLCISEEPSPKLLFARRSANLRTHAGEISFPGGKREAQDPFNYTTAFREAQEETALNPTQLTLKGYLPRRQSKSRLMVQPVVATIEAQYIPNLEPDKVEIDSLFWLDISNLMQAKTIFHTFQRQNMHYAFPAFRQQNDVIWGLTWYILMSLLGDIYHCSENLTHLSFGLEENF